MQRQIAAMEPWLHNLHLPDGTQTAPNHPYGDFPSHKWNCIRDYLPRSLQGWTALDIGCNAGFYSLELAKRGAQVTATDVNRHCLNQARWAAGVFGLEHQIEFREMQVYDLARMDEKYDLVLFLGVFYHLRYPMLGLDIVARKTRQFLLFQTLTMPGKEVYQATDGLDMEEREVMLEAGWPKMAFIEHRLAGDPTNWWAPNHAAVEAMLRSSGMRVIASPGHEIYVCEPDPFNPSCMTTWNAEEYDSATGRAASSPVEEASEGA
ncbi:MAG: TIGR04290 family methyltransferase [Acidobacteriota bacterium]